MSKENRKHWGVDEYVNHFKGVLQDLGCYVNDYDVFEILAYGTKHSELYTKFEELGFEIIEKTATDYNEESTQYLVVFKLDDKYFRVLLEDDSWDGTSDPWDWEEVVQKEVTKLEWVPVASLDEEDSWGSW